LLRCAPQKDAASIPHARPRRKEKYSSIAKNHSFFSIFENQNQPKKQYMPITYTALLRNSLRIDREKKNTKQNFVYILLRYVDRLCAMGNFFKFFLNLIVGTDYKSALSGHNNDNNNVKTK
jgi:uncharacterized protein YaaR (DUF327 family)